MLQRTHRTRGEPLKVYYRAGYGMTVLPDNDIRGTGVLSSINAMVAPAWIVHTGTGVTQRAQTRR